MKASSRVPILAPELGAPRATFSLWHVRVGERVTAGDRVAEVLIPGAAVDVHAPVGGTLAQCEARPGDALTAGRALGEIQED